MSKVVIVGLGPGQRAYASVRAWEAILEAEHLILRTERHPIVEELKAGTIAFASCDRYYDKAENFEEVYDSIAEYVLETAEQHGVVHYAVPGHPFVLEKTVDILIRRAHRRGIETEVIPSMSSTDMILARLGVSATSGVMLVDALDDNDFSAMQGHSLLVTQVYNRFVAGDIKLSLLEFLPPEHEVVVIIAAGVEGAEKIIRIPLHELDRQELNHLASVYVPRFKGICMRSIDRLLEIMGELRGPQGCPWDREQTHESLRPYLLEETYEVLDALDAGDMYKLCEELGDLLLQIVFHARIAQESGKFEFADIVQGINEKMERRHPHVFGSIQVAGTSDVLHNWEQIKRQEKQQQNSSQSMLDSIPGSMPALMQASKVQEKAARVGFDWDDATGAWDKLYEELEELREAWENENASGIREELGDLLFATVNVSRFLGQSAELGLLQTVNKFRQRFAYIERQAEKDGNSIVDYDIVVLDNWWEEAKKIGL